MAGERFALRDNPGSGQRHPFQSETLSGLAAELLTRLLLQMLTAMQIFKSLTGERIAPS
jgi:hypothetical protein